MTTAVAVYAAIVATIGLLWQAGWQLFSWRRSRQTHVKVTLGTYVIGPQFEYEVVIVEVINEGERPIHVRRIQLLPEDPASSRYAFREPAEHERPTEIASHSSQPWISDAETLRYELDFRQPITAQAVLGDGKVFRSPPTTL